MKIVHDEKNKSFDVVVDDGIFCSFYYDFTWFGQTTTKAQAEQAAKKYVKEKGKK